MRVPFITSTAVSTRLLPVLLLSFAAVVLLICLIRAMKRSVASEKAAQEAAMEQDDTLFPVEEYAARVTAKYQDIGPDPRYPASVPRVRNQVTFAYNGQEKTFTVPEEAFQAITLCAVGTLLLQDGAFLGFDVQLDGIAQAGIIEKRQEL
ncbi:MAG: hypothetical protein IK141_02910 [Clostridia bacterium]|nr:hypothetical protein [Clostridia bacterium]